jgi:hypothetical protein
MAPCLKELGLLSLDSCSFATPMEFIHRISISTSRYDVPSCSMASLKETWPCHIELQGDYAALCVVSFVSALRIFHHAFFSNVSVLRSLSATIRLVFDSSQLSGKVVRCRSIISSMPTSLSRDSRVVPQISYVVEPTKSSHCEC